MLEKGKPEYATILAFDVKIDSEARNQVLQHICVVWFSVSAADRTDRTGSDGSDSALTTIETKAELIAPPS